MEEIWISARDEQSISLVCAFESQSTEWRVMTDVRT